jgi:transposase
LSKTQWESIPEDVQAYIEHLESEIARLTENTVLLEKEAKKAVSKLKENSQNSNKPPSSDVPYNRPEKERKPKGRRRGAQKGHKGHQQKRLEPTRVQPVMPEICSCGCCDIEKHSVRPFYTHQYLELPEIEMDVTHFILHKGCCAGCGKTVKAQIPKGFHIGYGPRLSALVAEFSGIQGSSRQTVKEFCRSVLNFPISTGAIQNIIDRTSDAIRPTYEQIGSQARSSKVNYADETSWFQCGKLRWLWTLVNTTVAFFMIHPNRSAKAFKELIQDWRGILVSDGYGVYVKWVDKRQTCLAHLIRKAKALSQRKDESEKRFGENIQRFLQQLCQWAKAPPSETRWTKFYSEFLLMLILFENADGDAGKLARNLIREIDSLWVFLDEHDVEPTNNRAERSIRFGVLWRKRSNGTQSDKGDRWVERILSLRQTCMMRGLSSYPILVDLLTCHFNGQQPNLQWLK